MRYGTKSIRFRLDSPNPVSPHATHPHVPRCPRSSSLPPSLNSTRYHVNNNLYILAPRHSSRPHRREYPLHLPHLVAIQGERSTRRTAPGTLSRPAHRRYRYPAFATRNLPLAPHQLPSPPFPKPLDRSASICFHSSFSIIHVYRVHPDVLGLITPNTRQPKPAPALAPWSDPSSRTSTLSVRHNHSFPEVPSAD